jgi:hypothetical protein
MWVIRRTDQRGGWVTPPGRRASYTYDLTKAKIFGSREAADAERCPENEIVEAVEDLLHVN